MATMSPLSERLRAEESGNQISFSLESRVNAYPDSAPFMTVIATAVVTWGQLNNIMPVNTRHKYFPTFRLDFVRTYAIFNISMA